MVATIKPATEGPATPAGTYDQRRRWYAERREHYNRLSSRNANISLALIAAALLCLLIGLWQTLPALLIAAPFFGVAFVISFVVHGRIIQVHQHYSELWSINNEGLLRLQRNWAELPLRDDSAASPQHPYAADLDLLGHASLLHLLAQTATPAGQATLRDWLLAPANRETIVRRQAAVAELRPLVELREKLLLHVRRTAGFQLNPERFLAWAEDADWLARRPWLLWVARLQPVLLLGALIAQMAGWLAFPLWLVLAAAGLMLTLTIGGRVDEVLERGSAQQGVFTAYADLFSIVGASSFSAAELRRLQMSLAAGDLSAVQQMRRLGRIMALSALRHWLPFMLVQVATLWNVHVLWLLERWRRNSGQHAHDWIIAFGEVEALAALATLAHDNPDWVFPEISADLTAPLTARDLGHPLLAPDTCVTNHVKLGPPGTLLLVTGSNMSGKSTLLRAIGINIVLAQAGAPVCASFMSLPPIALATSMRVQDSLEQGMSYFMAELQRLRVVVDAARRERTLGQRVLLFLLDEILHGTNTSERAVAVHQVILHLLDQGAMGAISTHDLALADIPDIAAVSEPVHFTETIINGPRGLEMDFDYKLRPGVATSTNALVLVAQVLGSAFARVEGSSERQRAGDR